MDTLTAVMFAAVCFKFAVDEWRIGKLAERVEGLSSELATLRMEVKYQHGRTAEVLVKTADRIDRVETIATRRARR